MTDKEFKRLSRPQLIDIIYQFQLKQEELEAENEELRRALADKRILVNDTGNLAQAALEIHHVMQDAQSAAEHYLEEIQLRVDSEYKRIMQEAKEEAAALLERARRKAAKIVTQAEKELGYDPVVEAILEEYKSGQ